MVILHPKFHKIDEKQKFVDSFIDYCDYNYNLTKSHNYYTRGPITSTTTDHDTSTSLNFTTVNTIGVIINSNCGLTPTVTPSITQYYKMPAFNTSSAVAPTVPSMTNLNNNLNNDFTTLNDLDLSLTKEGTINTINENNNHLNYGQGPSLSKVPGANTVDIINVPNNTFTAVDSKQTTITIDGNNLNDGNNNNTSSNSSDHQNQNTNVGQLKRMQYEYPLGARVQVKDDLPFSQDKDWGNGNVTGYAYDPPHMPLIRPDGWIHSVQWKNMKVIYGGPKNSSSLLSGVKIASQMPNINNYMANSPGGKSMNSLNSVEEIGGIDDVSKPNTVYNTKLDYKIEETEVAERDKRTGEIRYVKKPIKVASPVLAAKHQNQNLRPPIDSGLQWEISSIKASEGGTATSVKLKNLKEGEASVSIKQKLEDTKKEEEAIEAAITLDDVLREASYGAKDGGNRGFQKKQHASFLAFYRQENVGIQHDVYKRDPNKSWNFTNLIPEWPEFDVYGLDDMEDSLRKDMGIKKGGEWM